MTKIKTKSQNTTLAQKIVNCNDTVMTVDDVAALLGKSHGAIVKMCQRKQIPAHKDRRDWIFIKSEVNDWARNLVGNIDPLS